MSDVRSSTPGWFEARQTELAGDGYPDLGRVPVNSTYRESKFELSGTRKVNQSLLVSVLQSPRSAPTYLTPEAISQWGDVKRASVEKMNVRADFLTDEEVAALKAKFNRSRARR
ncbi:hypothetical protein [Henriciella litoralis]|uniref:hypothetical protein n=1 Tax=Henriciella litoralis TaxID=568102 RepID=UPI00111C0452|nr:hypothetical protein [Henriciella litoralis]